MEDLPLIALTPPPPYFAVIFTTLLADDVPGYADMADRMMDLASRQPGYLGVESVRAGSGITISYWSDEASIRAWRDHAEHALARRLGRESWYTAFALRVCRVDRDLFFERPTGQDPE